VQHAVYLGKKGDLWYEQGSPNGGAHWVDPRGALIRVAKDIFEKVFPPEEGRNSAAGGETKDGWGGNYIRGPMGNLGVKMGE